MQYLFKNKGFALIDIAVMLVVFAVLVIITVLAYGKFIKEAMVSEGKTLASSVAKINKYHHSETGNYHNILNASYSTVPEIYAKQNEYFRNFSVYVPGNHTDSIFTVITKSEMNILAGVQVVLHVFENKPSILNIIDIKNDENNEDIDKI